MRPSTLLVHVCKEPSYVSRRRGKRSTRFSAIEANAARTWSPSFGDDCTLALVSSTTSLACWFQVSLIVRRSGCHHCEVSCCESDGASMGLGMLGTYAYAADKDHLS